MVGAATLMCGSVWLAPATPALAFRGNGCTFSALRISYKVTPPDSRITRAARTNYYNAISSARGYWNNRVKPQFFLTSFSGPTSSLTFDYKLYGSNGYYGWVTSTQSCDFWSGPHLNYTLTMGFPYNKLILLTVHEMGHTLGLDHSQYQNAALWSDIDLSYSLGVIGPQADDVSGVNFLYALR